MTFRELLRRKCIKQSTVANALKIHVNHIGRLDNLNSRSIQEIDTILNVTGITLDELFENGILSNFDLFKQDGRKETNNKQLHTLNISNQIEELINKVPVGLDYGKKNVFDSLIDFFKIVQVPGIEKVNNEVSKIKVLEKSLDLSIKEIERLENEISSLQAKINELQYKLNKKVD